MSGSARWGKAVVKHPDQADSPLRNLDVQQFKLNFSSPRDVNRLLSSAGFVVDQGHTKGVITDLFLPFREEKRVCLLQPNLSVTLLIYQIMLAVSFSCSAH